MSFSASKYVWGVKITLNQAITEDTDIGLYDNSGLSEFRWITNTVSTTLTYKDGILAEKGIGTIGQEADFTVSGNIATVKGFTCSIASHIDNVPMWEIIRDAGINLIGKQIQIIEFDHSTDPATETIIRTFVIDKINSWNEDSYSFECVSPYHKRNTYISEQDENGNDTPVLFGKEVLSKLSAIIKNIILDISDCPGSYVMTDDVWEMGIYPVVAKATSGQGYFISIAVKRYFLSLDLLKTFLYNKTLKIVKGGEEGTYRTIDSSLITLSSVSPFGSCINIYVIDDENKISTYSSSDASFCQFLDFEVSYPIDSWPCANVVDYKIFKLEEDFLDERSGFLYNLDSTSKEILFLAKYFRDTNSVATFYTSGKSYISTINTFSLNIESTSVPMSRRGATSLYVAWNPVDTAVTVDIQSSDILDTVIYDKKGKASDILHKARYVISNIENSLAVVKPQAILLELNNTLTVKQLEDELYLGINLKITTTVDFLGFVAPGSTAIVNVYAIPVSITHDNQLSLNPASTSSTNMIVGQQTFTESGTLTIDFNNIPEDYYNETDEESTWQKDIFKLPFLHVDNNSLKANRLGVLFVVSPRSNSGDEGVRVDVNFSTYELKIMAKQDDSLTGEIYSNLSGRIYDSTWSLRKTETALIESPIDILEHVKRLERNDTDDIDFGHEYSPSVSIDTDSFDSTTLTDISNMKAGRQITSESDQWTGKIAESLCKEFYLCSYQDNLGQEAVSNILRDNSTPTVSIDFTDIIPGSIGSVEEIGVADIFCEPFVKYNFNPAYDKFDGQIKITNTHKATFDASYVVGLEGGEATLLWNYGRALYLKYGTITAPPEDRTNLNWIYRKEDAVKLLLNWFTYQGAWQDEADGLYKAASRKRFTFSVPYNIAMLIGETRKAWYVSLKIAISFPFHTSSETVYCVIENIEFDIDDFMATVTVLTYDVTDELQFYVKDTYGTSDGDDWKDTYLTKAEAATNGNDIKDNT